MSLPSLMGGADCGPVNPLAQLSKRLGAEGGAGGSQWDRQVGGSSSNHASSQSSFRSRQNHFNHSNSNTFGEEEFYRNQQQQQQGANAFDLSKLQGSLPFAPVVGPQGAHLESVPHINQQFENHHQMEMQGALRNHNHNLNLNPNPMTHPSPSSQQQHHPSAPSPSGWAAAFLNKNQLASSPNLASQEHSPQRIDSPSINHSHLMNRGMGMGMSGMGMMGGMNHLNHQLNTMNQISSQMYAQHGHAMGMDMDIQSNGRMGEARDLQKDTSHWETAFAAHDQRAASPPAKASSHTYSNQPDQVPLAEKESVTSQDADDLARTAGELISNVSHETNSKFAQSNFLELMRKLRDREAGIKGADIVSTEAGQSSFSTSEKGKGKERELNDSSRPRNQQEAYNWAKEMAARGQSSVLPPSMQSSMGSSSLSRDRMSNTAPSSTLSSELEGRSMLNDLWAEEDARSEAIEKAARERAERSFVGDAGDVASRMREDDAEAREFERYRGLESGVLGARPGVGVRGWEEDFDQAAASNQAEEMDSQDFVGRNWEQGRGRGKSGWQQGEWDKLQDDWDQWMAGPDGISRVESHQDRMSNPPLSASSAPSYKFMTDNPYRTASPSGTTYHHSHHSASQVATSSQLSALDSVLEREAAVQADPRNASAWLSLGLKQQENEREEMAIAALHKALEIDPSCKEAWLGLAVSYTNENQREAAMESVERWIDSSEKYAGVVAAHRASTPSLSSSSPSGVARHKDITDTLIAIARHSASLSASPEMDADVQVALGVLFNASEEYDKAVDCFSAALSVRPDDWLLYNRLGATLSNSGRSDEAIGYYGRALELQPGFVRAHFNACVACMNLKLYNDAATHIYTALHLQQAEAEVEGAHLDPSRTDANFNSGSLWETFRVALELMNRPDLADLTASRDINLFDPSEFAL